MSVTRFFLVISLALALGLATAAAPSYGQEPGQTQAYVVQKGDTIGSIARKFYGKSSLGSKLWRANRNLVAHPNRLTAGDTIYIFPESTLALNTAVEVPPMPESPAKPLYAGERLLTSTFPEYFSFVADPRGLGGTGITRVLVKIMVPSKDLDPATGAILVSETTREIDQLYEVHEVGEIIASSDRGFAMDNDYANLSKMGRLLLSTGDTVIVRFTQDLSMLLDSETYGDYDPYFNVFPIYGMEDFVQGPNQDRPDYGKTLGRIFKFRGRLHVVSRVEGLAPYPGNQSTRAKRSAKNNQDLSGVSYVAKIIYAEDAINISDRIFVFIPTDPGPERLLASPYTEPPDTYVSPGN